MKPTCTRRRPRSTSARTMVQQASSVVASGFSQKTGLPARIAAVTNSSWLGPQEHTSTASTSGSSITPWPVACGTAVPRRSATCRARASSASLTAVTRPPASTVDRRRTWSWPIMPTPITPTLTIVSSLSTTRGGIAASIVSPSLFPGRLRPRDARRRPAAPVRRDAISGRSSTPRRGWARARRATRAGGPAGPRRPPCGTSGLRGTAASGARPSRPCPAPAR